MGYFFDSYGIIELIKNSPAYQKFKDTEIVTNAINISEVYYFFLVNAGEEETKSLFKNLKFTIKEISKENAIQASIFRFKNKSLKLSYADCLGYICAKSNTLIFVTGDDAFNGKEGVEFVK